MNIELYKKISSMHGPSGNEHNMKAYMKEALKDADEILEDRMGGVFGVFKGEKEGPKIMICAHMDEVGAIITDITKDGFMKITSIGGVNPEVLVSIIPFIAGMIILMDAFEKVKHAIDLKKMNLDEWWIDLIVSMLFIVFGLIVIINPFKTAKLLIRILGIFFLVDCFADVWNNFSYEKIKIRDGKEKEIVVIDEKNE